MDYSTSSSYSDDYSDYSGSEDESNVLQKSSRLRGKNGVLEDGHINKKKRLNEVEATAAEKLSKNLDEKERKRLARPSLKESKLVGSDGLIRIKHEFPSKLKYHAPSTKAVQNALSRQQRLALEVDAAAAYSSQLLSAYANFCHDLMPSWNFRDTLRKIEDLGSKKLVRDHLHNMRQDICKDRLTVLYGKDKAERWLHELEHGLRAHDVLTGASPMKSAQYDSGNHGEEEQHEPSPHNYNGKNVMNEIAAPVTNTVQTSMLHEDEEKEMEFEEEWGYEEAEPSKEGDPTAANDDDVDEEYYFDEHSFTHGTFDPSPKENECLSSQQPHQAEKSREDNDVFDADLIPQHKSSEKNPRNSVDNADDDLGHPDAYSQEELLILDSTQPMKSSQRFVVDESAQDRLIVDSTQDQVVFDSTQDFNETQTYVPTMTVDDSGFDTE